MAWIIPVMAFASMAFGAAATIQQFKAASDAEAAARANARITLVEGEEQARRLEREQAITLGKATARGAASGVLRKGSPGFYLQDMEAEMGQELAWLKSSTKMKAEMEEEGGSLAYTQGMATGLSTAAGTASTAATTNWGAT